MKSDMTLQKTVELSFQATFWGLSSWCNYIRQYTSTRVPYDIFVLIGHSGNQSNCITFYSLYQTINHQVKRKSFTTFYNLTEVFYFKAQLCCRPYLLILPCYRYNGAASQSRSPFQQDCHLIPLPQRESVLMLLQSKDQELEVHSKDTDFNAVSRQDISNIFFSAAGKLG